MFGIFRFILAVFVVVTHIAQPTNGLILLGGFAVYGFFILSGYLMTLVMNKRYGFTTGGIKKFLLNRFLRIYPTYWLSVLISLVLLIVYGQPDLQQFIVKIRYPDSWHDVLSNIFIFGLARTGFFALPPTILSPTAWALEIELTFYIAIGLGLGKRKYAIPWLIWTVVAIVFARIGCAILGKINHQTYGFSYGSLLYASLAFVAGSLLFHYQDKIVDRVNLLKSRWHLTTVALLSILTILFFANVLLSMTVTKALAFPVNTIVMILILMCLLGLKPSKESKLLNIDKILGGISYPIYLLHFQIAFVVSKYAPGAQAKGWTLCYWSLPAIILGSLLIHLTFENSIEKIRSAVKTAPS